MIFNGDRIVAAVEIGTSKVAVLVAVVSSQRSLRIIGMSVMPARGIRRGEVIDYKAASEVTHSALEAAERQAGVRIEEVWLAQSGGYLESFYSEATVNVKSVRNIVGRHDITRVCKLAVEKELPPGHCTIHHIRGRFKLDEKQVDYPERMLGQSLQVGYLTVHAQGNMVADNIHLVTGFHLNVSELVLSSLASAAVLTTEHERSEGTLVIDIGGGITDFVLYRDGHVSTTGTVPVAGDHVTNDLSIALRVPFSQAEAIKLRYACGVIRARSKDEKVWANGDGGFGDCQIPSMAIETITAARIEELFVIVRKKLGHIFSEESCRAGIILTGGSSHLPGIKDAAAQVFGLPVRNGEAPAWANEALRDPMFSTVLGVLYFGLRGGGDQAVDGCGICTARGLRERLADFWEQLSRELPVSFNR